MSSISEFDDSDLFAGPLSTFSASGTRGCERKEENVDYLPQAIHATFENAQKWSFRRQVQVFGGSAKVTVERNKDGTTQAGAEIEYVSEDGKVTVGAEGKVDSDGNVSGKASAGINFQRD